MSLLDLFILAVGLSMDAMAVAICKGLSAPKLKLRHALVTGLYFGGFQAAMPLLGFLLGLRFRAYIESVDHWIAFVLLGFLGAKMIKDAFDDAEEVNCSFCPKAMIPMAVATSIDALVVGITFAFLKVSIIPAVSFIGVITFSLSAVGVYVGHLFGAKFRSKAELIGGIVLILMGLRILLEHLKAIDWFLGLL
ncbi:MAG: manganese efflux pump [Ruminococcaceae bacterium]|nr:manganese efflux pump [Oscillospiraceae bacterium]